MPGMPTTEIFIAREYGVSVSPGKTFRETVEDSFPEAAGHEGLNPLALTTQDERRHSGLRIHQRQPALDAEHAHGGRVAVRVRRVSCRDRNLQLFGQASPSARIHDVRVPLPVNLNELLRAAGRGNGSVVQ